MMQKWNEKLRRYFPYDPPVKDGIYPLICYDMDTVINCAQCGKEVKFGDCFTSMEIHNDAGFGFSVCEDCYDKEWHRRKLYEKV